MVEVDSIPQQKQETIAQIDSTDLVIGVVADFNEDELSTVFEDLASLPGTPRIVVLRRERPGRPDAAHLKPPQGSASLSVLPWSALAPDPSTVPIESLLEAYQSIFAVAARLQAKGCCVISSKMENETRWVHKLVQPLLENDYDLIVPYYAIRKLQGLLNSSIIYPLTRCLYGKRVHNPLGPDLGVSQRLAQQILRTERNAAVSLNRIHPLASLARVAVCDDLKICQVHVGARVYPPVDWTDISSLVAQVLGPVFLEMERSAACWQRTRGSVSVPALGEPVYLPQATAKVSVDSMVQSFQLGVRDLQEIWGLVLPPATLFELRKLSRLAPEQFYLPDDLWARIVYDFALAHRLRTINRDHLLSSMTPLYLAWVASYTRQVETAETGAVERKQERLSLAYETTKPYLVSRWRWPDRFNP